MTTSSDASIGIENAARHRAVTADALEAARGVRNTAQAARDALGYTEAGRTARIRLVILEKEARLGECQRVFDAAHGQWTTLVGAARRARHETRLRQAQAGLQPVVALLTEDRRDEDEVLATLGLAMGAGAHPLSAAAGLVDVLRYHLRLVNPPPPAPVPPPRPGMTRVRATTAWWDADGGMGIKRAPGDVFDVREEFVRELRTKQLAEPIEA